MPRSQVARKQQDAGPRAGSRARTDTRGNPKELDTRAQAVGQAREVQIPLEGPARLEGADYVQPVDGPNFARKADELAFMEEQMVIVVHQTAEKNPENPVYVAVNGRGCYIFRGQRTLVRRKYVDRLARAKIDSVTQDVNAKSPEEVNRLTINSALRYPFSVLEDKNPVGAPWLQKVLQEG